jgi:hypothetical protein
LRQNNTNHFCDRFAEFLTGTGIPDILSEFAVFTFRLHKTMEEILISAQISLIGLSNPLFTTDGQNEERFALRVKKKSEVPPD